MKYLNPAIPAAIVALLVSSASAAVYTSGHADFGVGYEGGELNFHFHAEGGTVDGIDRDDEEFSTSVVVTSVPAEAMLPLPVDFAPLDAPAGATIWVLPEIENMSLPFLGLATEELNPAQWGNITFSLGTVSSPSGNGHFALWQSGSFGELLLRMSTADPGTDSLQLLPGSHAHYNWAFTEPGIWEIEMRVSGVHGTDGPKSSSGKLTFNVVPEPSVCLVAGLGLVGGLLRRRR